MRLNYLLWTVILVVSVVSGTNQTSRSIRPRLNGAGDMSVWSFVGSGKWEIGDGKLMLVKAGIPEKTIRRPAALAIVQSDPFQSVTVDLELRSTAPLETLRRDVDLVFGYESPTRFYYVHLAGVVDDVHNGIFLVADADRRRIDSGKAQPQLKDLAWHKARLVRDGLTGKIEVYFDNSAAPVLTANDQTIKSGRVGVGSFDDTGEFRSISISGSTR